MLGFDSIYYATWPHRVCMVGFELDEMQQMLRDLAREFAMEEVRPNAEHWDLNSQYPLEAIRTAHEMGLLNLHIPEEYGGPGLGLSLIHI